MAMKTIPTSRLRWLNSSATSNQRWDAIEDVNEDLGLNVKLKDGSEIKGSFHGLGSNSNI
ncbi:hypothetical protein DY000_02055617 [Brassica cretica]|uniref:LSM domain-containing protein n=1 Tax=Brassica cretica TaxID=69181 RepID=A0ABQ7AGE4_BRACR|nr:hypothetical protein DY000_02055617 [Brassica cretica]